MPILSSSNERLCWILIFLLFKRATTLSHVLCSRVVYVVRDAMSLLFPNSSTRPTEDIRLRVYLSQKNKSQQRLSIVSNIHILSRPISILSQSQSISNTASRLVLMERMRYLLVSVKKSSKMAVNDHVRLLHQKNTVFSVSFVSLASLLQRFLESSWKIHDAVFL